MAFHRMLAGYRLWSQQRSLARDGFPNRGAGRAGRSSAQAPFAKSYRPDIDGLRAIAVLSVISFHLSRRVFAGGFLGVDVFFVISGYLITSILWREMTDGRYSIVKFYDRRVRRIMPALLLVLAASSVCAVAVLLPADLIGFGKSLLATLAFVANIYFWRDTDYFGGQADQKPLLHMWSLGVEEQFYILFPLALFLLKKAPDRIVISVIGCLTVLSGAGNAAALSAGGGAPAFFLLPTRAWELGAGALLALLPGSGPARTTTASVIGLLGVTLVIVAIVHPATPLAILPPATPAVIGTSLAIWAGADEKGAARRLLHFRPLVFVGLISYSLYLWHWPIIVFAKYYLVRELTVPEALLLIPLMILVAAASWQFVERPFRASSMPIAPVRIMALGGSLLLSAVAVVTVAAHGFPQRLNPAAAVINEAVGTNYRCPVTDYLALGKSRACTLNLPSRDPRAADTALLGNSHMQMYAPVWRQILVERGRKGLLVPLNSCLPTVSANITTECIAAATRNLTEVLDLQGVQTVVLGLNWGLDRDALVDEAGKSLDNVHDSALIAALDDLIARIQKTGRHVILIGPLAIPGWDIASVLSRELAFGRPLDEKTFATRSDFLAQYDLALQHFTTTLGRSFARPDTVQCASGTCQYLLEGHCLFSDSSHLATAELYRFRGIFENALP